MLDVGTLGHTLGHAQLAHNIHTSAPAAFPEEQPSAFQGGGSTTPGADARVAAATPAHVVVCGQAILLAAAQVCLKTCSMRRVPSARARHAR